MKPTLPKLNPKQQKLLTPLITILIALLSFLGGSQYQKYITPSLPSTPSYPSSATVSRIIDGDTLELETGQSVRLYGISCPEYGDPFFDEATNFTKDLTANQTISLEYESGYEQDKFGRLLTYVLIPNPPALPDYPDLPNTDLNLNIELARQGLAEVKIYEKRRKLIYQDELLEAQSYAQENKLGIWVD